jgi:hypothetical protein
MIRNNKKQIIESDKPKEISAISKKFNVIIDKNNNPVIWIDDIVHFFTQSQYDAFIKQSLYIAHKMNLEIDYSKYLK